MLRKPAEAGIIDVLYYVGSSKINDYLPQQVANFDSRVIG